MKQKNAIRLDESYSGHVQKKWTCPSCGKKRFVRFYNFKTSEYLDEQFGRCDRSENCGYYQSPFSDEKFVPGKSQRVDFVPEVIKTVYVDKSIVSKTLSRYEENEFACFLAGLIGWDRALELLFRYFVGTAKERGTIFWQVDSFMMTRTGQKMFYKPDGHRDKTKSAKKLFLVEDNYRSCLFGEHRLFVETGDFIIGIVESEKTAILADAYMTEVSGRKIVWLASSGSNGLTNEKIQCLRGRDVMLAPDFSFHARATWGLLPMRKKYVDKVIKGETKKILLPHPEGDLVEYESAADRLRAIGCAVSFFDPFPNVDDGSDIADTFVQIEAPEQVTLPDFSDFKLVLDEQSDFRHSETLSEPESTYVPTGRHSFNLVREIGLGCQIRMNNQAVAEKLVAWFEKNKKVEALINTFGVDKGSVEFI